MAGPRRAAAQQDEEVFEDLPSNGGLPADGGADLGALMDDEDDEDLEVADEGDEEEGDEDGAREDEEDGGDEGGEEADDQPAAAAVVEFDPKDVVILTGRIEAMELREAQATQAKTRAEGDITRAKAAMEAAMEAGNTKDSIAAQEDFANAKIALENANGAINAIAGHKAALTRDAQALLARAPRNAQGQIILDQKVEAAPARAAATAPKVAPAVQKWLGDNKWYGDPKFSAQATTLQGLDSALAKENKLKKGSPEYLRELGTRFNRVFPGIYKMDGKPLATGARQRGNGNGRGGPIPAGDGGAGRPAPKPQGGKVVLTNQDLKDMAKFGMDPDSKAARRSWLTEKRALAAKEA